MNPNHHQFQGHRVTGGQAQYREAAARDPQGRIGVKDQRVEAAVEEPTQWGRRGSGLKNGNGKDEPWRAYQESCQGKGNSWKQQKWGFFKLLETMRIVGGVAGPEC